MPHLLVCVMDNLEKSLRLLDLWAVIGAKGMTVINGFRYQVAARNLLGEDTPLFLSLQNIFGKRESAQFILFSVAQDHRLAKRILRVSKKMLAEWKEEKDSLLFTVPLGEVPGPENE
jgi:hypothetical protein